MYKTKQNSDSPKNNWYAHWFGPKYDALYGHRDPKQAEKQVEFLLPFLQSSQRILDLGCGAGRHLKALKSKDLPVIGMDLSTWLLAQIPVEYAIAQASMESIPFKNRSFDAVLSFFSSFGYFPTAEDDLQILAQMTNLLSPNGCLFLDLANKSHVIESLHQSEHWIDGERVVQERYLEEDCVVKKITWEHEDEVDVHFEKLRLWDYERIEMELTRRGYAVIQVFGDEHGSPYTAHSPRMSLLAQLRS